MTDKEFKHLSRHDLITIIYELKRRETELEEELEQARQSAQEPGGQPSDFGTLVELAAQTCGFFEAAQKTADMYLTEVQSAHEQTEQKCAAMLEQAEKACQLKLEATDQIIAEKWASFSAKTNEVISAHSELQKLMGLQ